MPPATPNKTSAQSSVKASGKSTDPQSFSARLLDWYDHHGRKTLPWQQHKDPYRVWVSEIMLQQTQVTAVIPYYQKFMQRFTDIPSLAAATSDEVMHHWAGLGYYARARNLHKAAKLIVDNHSGEFPQNIDDVIALPGIGRSTAGAILAFCFAQHQPILDGNVKRVLTRMFALEGYPGVRKVELELWQIATRLTPAQRVGDYTQAIMDLGATLCVRSKPQCTRCPMQVDCVANLAGTQSLYPGRKPKKVKPVRATVMVVAVNPDGHILIEKRQSTGIWGGLWSLPEIQVENPDAKNLEQSWAAFAQSRHLAPVAKITLLEKMQHGFSHYDLDIQPIYIRVSNTEGIAVQDTDQRLWFDPENPQQIGLPAVVTRLLENLANQLKYQATNEIPEDI